MSPIQKFGALMFMSLVGAFPGCCLFWFLSKIESDYDFSPFDLTVLVMFSLAVLMIGTMLGFLATIVSIALTTQSDKSYEKPQRPLDHPAPSIAGDIVIKPSKGQGIYLG